MSLIFSTISLDIIAFSVILIAIAYAYCKYVFSYWERRGVKHIEPTFPLGNFTQTFLQKLSVGELIENLYYQTKEPFIGIYGAIRPTLLIRDTALIRRIFIKDFQYFVDRGVYINEAHDPLSATLFAMYGEKWKNLRAKLTPVFTSGKLKAMFSTLLDCGVPLKRFLDKEAEKGSVIEMREIAARYTTDIIGSTAFGIDVNTIDNPNQPFRTLGRKAFELNFKNGIRSFTSFIYPKLQNLIKLKGVDDDVEAFMINLLKDTMEYRERNGISRKDLLQLMIQLRNTGKVQNDDEWDTTIADDINKKLTLNEMAAQAWVFYLAGFETSASTMSFCLYELARNMEIQQKVQKEIDEISAKYNGEITYNSILEMKYLEWCMDETLRKYPVVPILNRECTNTYKIPNTNVIIEKGTPIIIPALALQRDPKYYPEPEKFIPERFNADNLKSFEDMPYMPFGEGPRNCIGVRMGKMQTKVGLVLMLQEYSYHLVNYDTLKISPKCFVLNPIGGINLKITKRVSK